MGLAKKTREATESKVIGYSLLMNREKIKRTIFSVSAFQRFSVSAFQRFSVSAFQRFSVSAFQLLPVQPPTAVPQSARQVFPNRRRAFDNSN
jgi:hypothetical protein